MSRLKISPESNENYLARIVKLGEPVKHPNADKLQGFVILSEIIWTDMSYNSGDWVVVFPLESVINPIILRDLNLFSEKSLNKDPEKKGYFGNKGRVRAVRLRGEPSRGFLLKFDVLQSLLGGISEEIKEGTEFDMWGSTKILEKYIPVLNTPKIKEERGKRKTPRRSRLIPNQFNLHVSTSQLKKNLHQINPDSRISITYKLHGTSFVVGNVLTKRKLTFWEKISKFFGAEIQEVENSIIYSSRRVIQNQYEEEPSNNTFYGVNIYKQASDIVGPLLPKGITVYGELVGQTPQGKWIQKNYDYGTKPLHFEIYIYRATFTNSDGFVTELSSWQTEAFCNLYGLKYVPKLFEGKASDYYGISEGDSKEIGESELQKWREEFYSKLYQDKKFFIEEQCYMCQNKVPAEGIVLRIDKLNSFDAYKLKSFKFLEHETKMLDEGEVDVEEQILEEVTN